MKNKHVRYKQEYADAEIPHDTKTGDGPAVLRMSFPYLLEWKNKHPFKNDPKAPLFYNMKSGRTLEAIHLILIIIFGVLEHPKTHRPARKLTSYQYAIWKDSAKYRLVIKSQKVGLTTSALIEDFQRAIAVCKGRDILIIAQSQDHANEHLRTLNAMIINSVRYSRYLITEPAEMLFREEKTKVKVAYIYNPDNPRRPTRI